MLINFCCSFHKRVRSQCNRFLSLPKPRIIESPNLAQKTLVASCINKIFPFRGLPPISLKVYFACAVTVMNFKQASANQIRVIVLVPLDTPSFSQVGNFYQNYILSSGRNGWKNISSRSQTEDKIFFNPNRPKR